MKKTTSTRLAILGAALTFCQAAGAEENFYCLGEKAVVLEYESVYDVHSEPDPERYPNLRAQPAAFDRYRILGDLEKHLITENYDFVAFYSLHEVPGWIHAGGSYSDPLGKNIGHLNRFSGQSIFPEGTAWERLRSTPSMNSVEFIDRFISQPYYAGGSLPIFHEIFHYWGPRIAWNYGVGPREWTEGDPIAWLGQVNGHWSWNFLDEEMPGIMYSAPTSNRFNAFDLYIMGLMGYEEASQYSYTIYEYDPILFGDSGRHHELTLDDLIFSLSLAGSDYYEGDGRRIPDLDPSATEFNTLIVIIKGLDEELSQEQADQVMTMADGIPSAWETATWGRSKMRVAVERNPPAQGTLQIERAGAGVNLLQQVPPGQFTLYESNDLDNWIPVEEIEGTGRVYQSYLPLTGNRKYWKIEP